MKFLDELALQEFGNVNLQRLWKIGTQRMLIINSKEVSICLEMASGMVT